MPGSIILPIPLDLLYVAVAQQLVIQSCHKNNIRSSRWNRSCGAARRGRKDARKNEKNRHKREASEGNGPQLSATLERESRGTRSIRGSVGGFPGW